MYITHIPGPRTRVVTALSTYHGVEFAGGATPHPRNGGQPSTCANATLCTVLYAERQEQALIYDSLVLDLIEKEKKIQF